MDEKVIKEIIDNYEDKLKERTPEFELTPFERLLMKESLKYGYDYCKKEIEGVDKNVQK